MRASGDCRRSPRARRLLSGVAVLGVLALLTGCASSTSNTTGKNTLEGGVKIPGTGGATSTATTVNVALGDNHGTGPMTLTLSPSVVPAGDVTFIVKNNGTIDHEAVVLKTNLPYNKIPIADAGDPPAPVKTGANKVSEDTNIGETGDPNLKPGETRTFTIKHMTAGNYAVVCNIANHYGFGIRAPLTVTNPGDIVNVALE